jgi:hypothetical protein
MKTKLKMILILLALLFVPTGTASAQEPGGDVFRLGQNYTLESDETLAGNLAVVGGNADIEKDAVVNGDIALIGGNLKLDGNVNGNVALIGGNLSISGKIDGDIVVIGGQALLTETAVVNGDIVTMGGQVTQEPGAQVSGEIVNNAPPINIPDVPNIPNIPNVPGVPNVPNPPDINVSVNPFWEVAGVVGRALAVAAIGMLLTLFLQPQMERVGDAIARQPVLAGSFGLLTLVLAPLVLVIMVVTLILIPVALIVAFVIPLAWLFGIVALGQEVGERFTNAINQTWAPVLATGFGTFLLLIVGGLVGLIPCVGWLVPFLVGLIAVGGVAMTWFGTRSAPGTMATPQVQVPPTS